MSATVFKAGLCPEPRLVACGDPCATKQDRLTHVVLLDKERPAPYTLAVGHGEDKVHALLSLWETLLQNDAAREAINYVAVEYQRRTGKSPGDPN